MNEISKNTNNNEIKESSVICKKKIFDKTTKKRKFNFFEFNKKVCKNSLIFIYKKIIKENISM